MGRSKWITLFPASRLYKLSLREVEVHDHAQLDAPVRALGPLHVSSCWGEAKSAPFPDRNRFDARLLEVAGLRGAHDAENLRLGFEVWDLGFRVQGLGLRVSGFGFKI